MRVNNTIKKAGRFGAAAVLALGVTVGFQPVAGAASLDAEWRLSVSASSDLVHGQAVTVAVSGFAPGSTVLLGQCAIVDRTPVCPTGSPRAVTADSGGTARIALAAQESFKAFRLDGSFAGTVDCAGNCFVVAADPRVCDAASQANDAGLSVALSFK